MTRAGESGAESGAGERLGPTTARNWGWASLFATIALLGLGAAGEATLRHGISPWETAVPVCLGGVSAVVAFWVWRQPPFERTALQLSPSGVIVTGRKRAVELEWSEIAAVTYRPSSMGPAHMTIERAAPPGDGGDPAQCGSAGPVTPAAILTARAHSDLGDAPGVMFPVRATGAAMEEVVAFLARGAANAGYALQEPLRGDGRAVHRFPGPRRWVMLRPAGGTGPSGPTGEG